MNKMALLDIEWGTHLVLQRMVPAYSPPPPLCKERDSGVERLTGVAVPRAPVTSSGLRLPLAPPCEGGDERDGRHPFGNKQRGQTPCCLV